MKCTECKCILSPEEEDEVLQSLAENIPMQPICNDCIDYLQEEEDKFLGDAGS